MLNTIKLINSYKEILIYKKISSISIFLFNLRLINYKNYKYINLFNIFFIETFILYFLKLIWRGKAYRIRFFKKFSKITFNFGHSHWTKLTYNKKNLSIFKLKRQNYLIILNKKKLKKTFTSQINSIRNYNKYTKRGVKIKHTPYIKRFGKISQISQK